MARTIFNPSLIGEQVASICFSFIFLIFTILSCIWFSFAFRKKSIRSRTIVFWLAINIIFLVISSYLSIISLIYLFTPNFDYYKYNFFEWAASKIFGIQKNGWIILLVILLLFVGFVFTIGIVIKFDEQNKKINDLNRNVAILKGKIASNIYDQDFDTSELSSQELKFLLEDQLSKEKLKVKYKNKLERLATKNNNVNTSVDSKTLLNIDDENKDK